MYHLTDKPVDYSAAERYIRSEYDKLVLLNINSTLIRRLYQEEVIDFDEKVEIQKLDKKDKMDFLLDIITKSLKLKNSSRYMNILKILKGSDDNSLKFFAADLIFCSFK